MNFTSITAAMVNHARAVQKRVTDFNIGSVIRTILESVAIQIDEFYQQLFNGIKEAIPVSTYNSFNFTRRAAQPANGLVRVTITAQPNDVLIAAGATFTNAGAATSYVSVADVTISAGNTYADVLVVAQSAGVAGNIASGTSFTVSPSPLGFVSAINSAAFSGGLDAETEDQRKQRFADYIQTISRATNAALIFGAKQFGVLYQGGVEIERARAVSVVEPWLLDPDNPISLVRVYVHNGVGSTSSDLVAKVRDVLYGYTDSSGNKVPGYKAAGVKVEVFAATEVTINVTATLESAPGYVAADLCDQAEAVISDYIKSLDIGSSYLKAEAIYRVKSIAGVRNIAGLPNDQTATDLQKLMPGTVDVTPA